MSKYNSKNRKNPKNYEYLSSSVSKMPSSSPNAWWCGECGGNRGGGRGGRSCASDNEPLLRICLKQLYMVIILYSIDCIYYIHCSLSFSCHFYNSMYFLSASSSYFCTNSFNACTRSRMSLTSVLAGLTLDIKPKEYNLL